MSTFTLHVADRDWRVEDEHLQDTYAVLDEIQRRGYGVLWILDTEGNETFLYLSRHTPVAVTFNSRAMSASAVAELTASYDRRPGARQAQPSDPAQQHQHETGSET